MIVLTIQRSVMVKVPREICWAGIKLTYYIAGIKMRIMIQEVELWKQEME